MTDTELKDFDYQWLINELANHYYETEKYHAGSSLEKCRKVAEDEIAELIATAQTKLLREVLEGKELLNNGELDDAFEEKEAVPVSVIEQKLAGLERRSDAK